jgi:hypothetical protein
MGTLRTPHTCSWPTTALSRTQAGAAASPRPQPAGPGHRPAGRGRRRSRAGPASAAPWRRRWRRPTAVGRRHGSGSGRPRTVLVASATRSSPASRSSASGRATRSSVTVRATIWRSTATASPSCDERQPGNASTAGPLGQRQPASDQTSRLPPDTARTAPATTRWLSRVPGGYPRLVVSGPAACRRDRTSLEGHWRPRPRCQGPSGRSGLSPRRPLDTVAPATPRTRSIFMSGRGIEADHAGARSRLRRGRFRPPTVTIERNSLCYSWGTCEHPRRNYLIGLLATRIGTPQIP